MCRKINKDDKKEKEQIEKIWLKRSIEVHRFVAPDPERFWRDRLTQFREDSEKEKAEGYVYKKDGEVKGFITWVNRNDYIYILELFAHESGKGIGPKLLNKVKELDKSKPLVLDVYVLNIGSVNWYSKNSFVVDEIRECSDNELKDLDCEKDRLKYKMQRRKFRMVRLPRNF